MKIAIFSDIHGNLQALESIINDIKNNNNYDEIICLGDTIGIGPNPKECLDIIIDNNIQMVLGNHELYYLNGTNSDDKMSEGAKKHQNWVKEQLNEKHYSFLKKCSLTLEKNIYGLNMRFCHFLLNEDNNDNYPFVDLQIINDATIMNKISLMNVDITFIGHEHKEFQISNNNKKLIDVGSSGCTKDENTFYNVITINDKVVNIQRKNLIYNRKKFEENFKNIDYPDKELINKIFFGVY